MRSPEKRTVNGVNPPCNATLFPHCWDDTISTSPVRVRISYAVRRGAARVHGVRRRPNPRKFAQLTALRKSRFAPILLLEGDPLRVGYSQMRPESIRGALTYITAILHVPILPSSGPSDSARLVYAAAKQCQIGYAAHGPAGGRRTASLSEQQMQIVLSLLGIGRVTARAVCARFRSLHDLLNADAAQLSTVPGVGPSRAAALEQLLHAALPTSHDALKSKRGEDVQMQAPYNIKEQELK